MWKIKPCPFCGGNAVLMKSPYEVPFPYFVRCENFVACSAKIVATCSRKTPEEAIRLWNCRPGEEDAYRRGVQALPAELTPCDMCKYRPASSGDDKPCAVCPAEAKVCE